MKTGSLYKQANSKNWWVKYYVPGSPRPIRESTKTADKEEANKFLWKRLGEVATSRFAGLEPERIKVNELLDMLEEEYENKGRKSIKQARIRVKKHLRPFFGAERVCTVGTRQITSYITKRKRAGAANATINRELELLRRAFFIGYKAQPQLVLKPLAYERLPEDNIRDGLVAHKDYLTIRTSLPEPYKTLFVCGYHLGTRAGELLSLQWSEVDFEHKEITLRRYTTKTKEPRMLPIYGDMEEFLLAAKARRDQLHPNCPWVFQRKGKKFIFGHRVWRNMVEHLGHKGLLFHDLRRTAVTNMLEAGFSEKDAMTISGHKTDRMLRRYQIVRRARIKSLGQKMEDFYNAQNDALRNESTGHTDGHSPSPIKPLIN